MILHLTRQQNIIRIAQDVNLLAKELREISWCNYFTDTPWCDGSCCVEEDVDCTEEGEIACIKCWMLEEVIVEPEE